MFNKYGILNAPFTSQTAPAYSVIRPRTYGMRIEQLFLSIDLAIGSYRRAVGTILPALTKVAWQIKRQEIRKELPA